MLFVLVLLGFEAVLEEFLFLLDGLDFVYEAGFVYVVAAEAHSKSAVQCSCGWDASACCSPPGIHSSCSWHRWSADKVFASKIGSRACHLINEVLDPELFPFTSSLKRNLLPKVAVIHNTRIPLQRLIRRLAPPQIRGTCRPDILIDIFLLI